MHMKNFWDMVTQDKRKQEKAKAAAQLAVGVGAIVIAAAAGVATGILIAPKSGRETREDLKQGCRNCMNHQACTPEKEENGDVAGSPDDTQKG
jgi:hypothetical protein